METLTREKAIKYAGIIENLSMNHKGLKARVIANVESMTEEQIDAVITVSDIIALGDRKACEKAKRRA